MKKTVIILLLLSGFSDQPNARQQLRALEDQWASINKNDPRDYSGLIQKVIAYRDSPGGRTWEVDYMLGSMYCATPGYEDEGQIAAGRVLTGYAVPQDVRQSAEKIRKHCDSHRPNDPIPDAEYVTVPGHTETAYLHGKGGFELLQTRVAMKTSIALSPVTAEELEKRVLSPDQTERAVKEAEKRLGWTGDQSAVGGGFVVVSRTYDPKYVSTCLARYEPPLNHEFGLQKPKDLVTVYVDSPDNLSAKLHGVTLPLGTIAYSVAQDLSIVGKMDGSGSCGTLAHELTHLAMRQSFGDCPTWLEEGLASEIAVAYVEDQSFHLEPSWRDVELKKHYSDRPSLDQLLGYNSNDFVAKSEHDVGRAAAVYAMAASFVRYLDDKHKLTSIFFAMRDNLSSSHPISDQDILSSQLGMTVAQIDADFAQWFSSQRFRYGS